MTIDLRCGDALALLREVPEESVQTCVTSPPYWGLRDYGVAGQLGLERTPQEYVEHMVEVFREVRRVLRYDGTLWLNLGDSYNAYNGNAGPSSGFSAGSAADTQRPHLETGHGLRTNGLKPKDMVGIPWRVAFALQQPHEVVTIKDRTDRAWLAAMIDGEGCITTTVAQPTTGTNESYAIVVQVRMCDRECLDRIVEITGMSRVQDEALSPSMVSGNQRPASCWKIAGENAATILAEIYPYLLIKRRQALVAWNLQRLKDGITTRRGLAVPAENMEQRRELHRVIRALNQRESVDVPDWCREPVYTVEPGWYLRSDVIWHKPNPMPESVTDRPTKAHEYLFLLSKSARYYYDIDAIREPLTSVPDGVTPVPYAETSGERTEREGRPGFRDSIGVANRPANYFGNPAGRNARSVWTITTRPYAEAHFATFPPELPSRCILAGTSEHGACPKCGAPWERTLERKREYDHVTSDPGKSKDGPYANQTGDGLGTHDIRHRVFVSTWTTGWLPTCGCGYQEDPVPCTVLDPFAGAGTTGLVADRLGRNFLGIDLNPDYVEMASQRIAADAPLFNEVP